MGIEILSCTAEHSSQYSSGASTATTVSGAMRPPTAPSLPVAVTDEAVTSRPVSAQSSSSSRFKGVVPQPKGRWGAQMYDRARVWLGTFPDEDAAARANDVAALLYHGREASTNYPCAAEAAELAFLAAHSKAEIVDMFRKHTYADELRQGLSRGRGMGARAQPTPAWARATLFEKAVTPIDVSELNRIVVPKQHAEKHFPLKCSPEMAGNGVLLNFEDGQGKVWRFRYSYRNSSQSYVFTKGWSSFVREKGLGAGDVIVFSCSAYGPEKQFFIDCKKSAPKASRCTDSPLEGTAKVDEVPVVRLFGVDIAGARREDGWAKFCC
ncbi:unnamed protein product [Alopecurus aequalis]